jgi:hypothetical protein
MSLKKDALPRFGNQQATEYAFLVQTCELPESAGSAADEALLIADKLASVGEPLQNSLATFDNGGWRVLSHHLLRTNGSLIVSFLVCRQRGDQP